MKKLLALVLALVMTLGLATVSSNAAYSDAADVTLNEAVDVMSAVGVFQGSDGKFAPKDNLTREQAAKLIAYLDLGETVAEALPAVKVFDDVEASRWSAKYIAYCQNAGYIAGVGDNKFNPTGELTGYAFGKMVLCVLGYDAEIEGLTGNNWSINVAKLMDSNSISDGIDGAASATLTREQAAQYCLNALKATMVEYDNKGTTVSAGGATIVTGASKAEAVTSTAAYNNAIDATGTDLQLGEKLYKGKLVLTPVGTDDLGRTANIWTYKGTDVSVGAETADYKFVVAKTGYTYANRIADKYSNFIVTGAQTYVNGNLSATANGGDVAQVGDVVELFMNANNAKLVDKIIVTQYSAAKVSAEVAVRTSGGKTYVRVPGAMTSSTVEQDKVHGYEDLAKNDVVYYYETNNGNWYFAKADSFEGKLTGTKVASGHNAPTVTIGGKTYTPNENIAAIAGVTVAVYNTTYKYFTDDNGYLVFAIAVEDEVSDYVIVHEFGAVAASGVNSSGYIEARIFRMDGTVETVKTDSVRLANTTTYTPGGAKNLLTDGGDANKNGVGDTIDAKAKTAFFTYTIDTDGNYELDEVVNGYAGKTNAKIGVAAGTTKIESGKTTSGTTATFNDNTVFVVNSKTDGTGKKVTVYTGKANVPTINAGTTWYVVAKDGIATNVYVNTYASAETSGDKILFLNATPKSYNEAKDSSNKTYKYNIYDAVVNGEITTVNVKATNDTTDVATAKSVKAGEVWTPTYDDNGSVATLTDATLEIGFSYGYTLSGGTLVTKTTATGSYKATGSEALYYKDSDGNYTKATLAEYSEDVNDAISVVTTKVGGDTVDYVYVQEMVDGGLGSLTWKQDSSAMDYTAASQSALGLTAVNDLGTLDISTDKHILIYADAITGADSVTDITYQWTGGAAVDNGDVSDTGNGRYVSINATGKEGNTCTVTITVTDANSNTMAYVVTFAV